MIQQDFMYDNFDASFKGSIKLGRAAVPTFIPQNGIYRSVNIAHIKQRGKRYCMKDSLDSLTFTVLMWFYGENYNALKTI